MFSYPKDVLAFCSARHVLCEKQGKINGDKVPPAEFAKANDASFFLVYELKHPT